LNWRALRITRGVTPQLSLTPTDSPGAGIASLHLSAPVHQLNQLFVTLRLFRDTHFHRGWHPERLVKRDEVVVEEVQRHRVFQVRHLLAEEWTGRRRAFTSMCPSRIRPLRATWSIFTASGCAGHFLSNMGRAQPLRELPTLKTRFAR